MSQAAGTPLAVQQRREIILTLMREAHMQLQQLSETVAADQRVAMMGLEQLVALRDRQLVRAQSSPRLKSPRLKSERQLDIKPLAFERSWWALSTALPRSNQSASSHTHSTMRPTNHLSTHPPTQPPNHHSSGHPQHAQALDGPPPLAAAPRADAPPCANRIWTLAPYTLKAVVIAG